MLDEFIQRERSNGRHTWASAALCGGRAEASGPAERSSSGPDMRSQSRGSLVISAGPKCLARATRADSPPCKPRQQALTVSCHFVATCHFILLLIRSAKRGLQGEMVSQFVRHVLQVRSILCSAANATHLAFNALRRLGRRDILESLLLGSWLWCCAGFGELPCWVSARHSAEVLHNPATADVSVLTSSMVAA